MAKSDLRAKVAALKRFGFVYDDTSMGPPDWKQHETGEWVKRQELVALLDAQEAEPAPDLLEIQRAWFYAGWAGGLQAVDKLGEEHDTAPEAFDRLKANEAEHAPRAQAAGTCATCRHWDAEDDAQVDNGSCNNTGSPVYRMWVRSDREGWATDWGCTLHEPTPGAEKEPT